MKPLTGVDQEDSSTGVEPCLLTRYSSESPDLKSVEVSCEVEVSEEERNVHNKHFRVGYLWTGV